MFGKGLHIDITFFVFLLFDAPHHAVHTYFEPFRSDFFYSVAYNTVLPPSYLPISVYSPEKHPRNFYDCSSTIRVKQIAYPRTNSKKGKWYEC